MGEVEISTRSVTDDVAAILAENGFDPDSFEVLSWPTGATRHSRIRLLMSKGDFDELKDALPDWSVPIGLEIVGLLFEKMYVLDHAVVAYSEASGPVYAVDVVDARYWWSTKDVTELGFNVTTDNREKYYDATVVMPPTDGPPPTDVELYTYREAIEKIFLDLAPFSAGELIGTSDRLDSSLGLKDLMVEGLPASQILGRLLILCGHTLVALHDGSYLIEEVELGAENLDFKMQDAGGKDLIITGGPAAVTNFSPTDPEILKLLDSPVWIARQTPASINVMFPTAMASTGQYRFNEESGIDRGRDYVMGRWFSVISTEGKPAGGDNAEVHTLFDPEWAIYDLEGSPPLPNIQNEDELISRADDVATFFYGRLSSGAGRMRFSKIVDMLYGGASEIHWSVVRHGPDQGVFTDVLGMIHDPILGYRTDQPITPADLLSIGSVRAIPRPDGGALLDSPPRKIRVNTARITEVNEDPGNPGFNATYKAQAIDDESITIPRLKVDFDDPSNLGERSDTRPAKDPLDLIPRIVDDLCFIVVDSTVGGNPLNLLFLWEQIDHEPCSPSPSPILPRDPIGEAMVVQAMGAF